MHDLPPDFAIGPRVQYEQPVDEYLAEIRRRAEQRQARKTWRNRLAAGVGVAAAAAALSVGLSDKISSPHTSAQPSVAASASPSKLPGKANVVSESDERQIVQRFQELSTFWGAEGVDVDHVNLVVLSGDGQALDCGLSTITSEGHNSAYCAMKNEMLIGAANFNSWTQVSGAEHDTTMALDLILDHEFGHVVTFEGPLDKTALPTPRQRELQANCYSGIYLEKTHPERVSRAADAELYMNNLDGNHNGNDFRTYFLQGAQAAQSAPTVRQAMAACAFKNIPDSEARPFPTWP